MVLITDNSMIFEIKTNNPADDLEAYQTAMIDVLDVFDYEMYGKETTLPVFSLLQQTFAATIYNNECIKIEIDTMNDHENMLTYYQTGLNDILSLHDYEKHGSHMVKPLFELLRQTTKVVFKHTK